jgi:hypothetical protein
MADADGRDDLKESLKDDIAFSQPMGIWEEFHVAHGNYMTHDECKHWVWLIDATRDTLIRSMKTCFAVRASTACLVKKSDAELLAEHHQHVKEVEERQRERDTADAASTAFESERKISGGTVSPKESDGEEELENPLQADD